MSHSVTVVEVGPRDGLQAESKIIPPAERVELISLLQAAGLSRIEVGSFVSPQAVPQMAGTQEVVDTLHADPHFESYMVLVPNRQGFEQALHGQLKQIAFFTAASETFAQRNIKATIQESLQRLAAFMPEAKEAGMHVRAYISCIAGCPYEGNIAPKAVVDVAEQLMALGCDEISLGDTTGVGTPVVIRELLTQIKAVMPISAVALHCHDTYRRAIPNIYTALECGVRIIDSSIAGLGGCPYAPGASGNVATEDVLYLLEGLGLHTGVDLEKIQQAKAYVRHVLKL